MRKIVFRAKRLPDGEWVYGDLECRRLDGRCFIHSYSDDRKYYTQYEVVPDTIGQYTGLKDANGEEIYEGDILDLYIPKNNIGKPEHRKRKVIWKDSGFRITNMHDDCVMDRVTSTIELIYTVIGNNHDNPELLSEYKNGTDERL